MFSMGKAQPPQVISQGAAAAKEKYSSDMAPRELDLIDTVLITDKKIAVRC